MISPKIAGIIGFGSGFAFASSYAYIYIRSAYWQGINKVRMFIIQNLPNFGDKDTQIDNGYWLMLAALSEFLLSDIGNADCNVIDVIKFDISGFDASMLPPIVDAHERAYFNVFPLLKVEDGKKEGTHNSVLVDSGTRLHS